MRTITAGQLRARLGEALDLASAGERIVIERDHEPIAAIVPIEDAQQLEGQSEEATRRKEAALERIRERPMAPGTRRRPSAGSGTTGMRTAHETAGHRRLRRVGPCRRRTGRSP